MEYADKVFLHFLVKFGDGLEWALTAMYAHPNPSVRRFLWDRSKEVEINRPWVVVGDFNCVLTAEERSSHSGASASFQNWVEDSGLLDMGFIRNRLT